MKQFFYLLYSIFFKIFRLFPVKENRISLVSPHNANFSDSLFYMKREFEKHGDFEFNCVSGNDLKSIGGALKFFTVKAYKTATSKFVFLNDNFMPFSMVNFSDKTRVVQLWHGQGVFKRFGLDTNLADDVKAKALELSKRYDYVAVTSKNVAPIYMSAFGVDESKIAVTGIPDSDFLYEKHDSIFRKKYNIPDDKKVVLYAPTFRDNKSGDEKISNYFDVDKFVEKLGDKYALVVRLHPQVHTTSLPDSIINATDYPNVNDIINDADVLITDYSSICMEFALLKKPMLFYAYDLDNYTFDRNFYFDYESYVPGKVVKDMNALIGAIESEDFETEKCKKFTDFNFDFDDGKSSERLYNFLTK